MKDRYKTGREQYKPGHLVLSVARVSGALRQDTSTHFRHKPFTAVMNMDDLVVRNDARLRRYAELVKDGFD